MDWSSDDERAAREAAEVMFPDPGCGCDGYRAFLQYHRRKCVAAIRTAREAGRREANCGDCFAAGFMAGEEAMRDRAAEVCAEKGRNAGAGAARNADDWDMARLFRYEANVFRAAEDAIRDLPLTGEGT